FSLSSSPSLCSSPFLCFSFLLSSLPLVRCLFSCFFFSRYAVHRDLHSFPTRRSSDLQIKVFTSLLLLHLKTINTCMILGANLQLITTHLIGKIRLKHGWIKELMQPFLFYQVLLKIQLML